MQILDQTSILEAKNSSHPLIAIISTPFNNYSLTRFPPFVERIPFLSLPNFSDCLTTSASCLLLPAVFCSIPSQNFSTKQYILHIRQCEAGRHVSPFQLPRTWWMRCGEEIMSCLAPRHLTFFEMVQTILCFLGPYLATSSLPEYPLPFSPTKDKNSAGPNPSTTWV